MTAHSSIRAPIRLKAAAMLAGLSLLLSACFITPGKFTSELALTGEDTFTFNYEGEIYFLGLSGLAEMSAGAEEFIATECYEDGTFTERACTEAEVAEQRADWDANADTRAAKAKQEAEQMSAMLGGIDPTDPEAAEKLRQLLLRHKGWDRVEDKGDGLFDVSYSITGSLSHDFIFPIIEGVPMTNPFVEIVLRDGNVARINAPGFAAKNDGNPLMGLMGGMFGVAGLAALSEGDAQAGPGGLPDLPMIEGTFTVVTDGRILANNTDEGPIAEASDPTGAQSLIWEISPQTSSAPTVLIDLSR